MPKSTEREEIERFRKAILTTRNIWLERLREIGVDESLLDYFRDGPKKPEPSSDDDWLTVPPGTSVKKTGGDYTFEGRVVTVFRKLDTNQIRIVVQDDRGILLIMNPKQLKVVR